MANVTDIERIATSQVVWAILFILLFLAVVKYLVNTSKQREEQLLKLYEDARQKSHARETKLMEQLESSDRLQSEMVKAVRDIQIELGKLNSKIDNFERGN